MSNWFDRAKHALASGSFLAPARACDQPSPWRRRFAFEVLEQRLTLSAAGLVTAPQTYSGSLSGKIVYTSGGHGWNNAGGSGWHTERPDYWQQFSGTTQIADGEIDEDLGNQDQMSIFADYALRAGATVVPMRPVGHQLNEIVLDNDSAGVTYSGSWTDNTAGTRWYDEDYGAVADPVRYRTAATSGSQTATATYTPNITAAGMYPVYAWASSGTDRTSQLYIINHTDGQTQVRVDHSRVGNGWVYLGTYHFDAGSSVTEGSVQISNQGTTGKVAVADAIRFGNGMGDIAWGSGGIGTGSVSGKSREDEYSLLWVWRGLGQGADPFTVFSNYNTAPFASPAIMAAQMNVDTNPFGSSVYIGIHSNGSTGDVATANSRGALGLYRSAANGNATPNQLTLANALGSNINSDMEALAGQFEYNWSPTSSSDTLSGSYAEISNAYYHSEMDATIIEVGYHDNQEDNALLRDPKARDQIARSIYEGVVQYFNTISGVANVTTPSPVSRVSAVSNASGQVTVSWTAGLSSPNGFNGVYGSPATGYRIYASTDGYGFDGGTLISGGNAGSATLSGYDPNTPYYFKVVAVNAGGESEASEVLTALPSGGPKQVLIVNGFDRFDRTQDFIYPFPSIDGITNRVWPTYNNSHNYVIQVASAIQASKPGVHVASTSNEAVISGAINLSDYNSVIWILGNESTANHTFDATEQTKVTNFVNGGGNLFVSGSEIGWDLDLQNHGRTFYEDTLQGNFVADDAGTYTVNSVGGTIFEGLSSLTFSNGEAFSQLDGQMYDVSTPDVIAPQAGAVSALTYGGSAGTAAIQAVGTDGKGKIVMFGFPLEAINSASRRQTIMGDVLAFFGADVAIATRVNGLDADAAPGPNIAIGSTATLKYVVTNPGIVPLSVSVVDDNGTPADTADDFNATYVSGDINSNGLLDFNETWTYTATSTVAAGQTTHIGKVTAISSTTTIVKSDPANYFGVVPHADFNGDATVDASDYVLWRKNSGLASGATLAQGDANTDGAVNNTDYNLWRGLFGSASGAGNGSSLVESPAVAAATSNDTQSTSTPVASRITALDLSTLSDSARDGSHSPFVSRASARVREAPSDWFALLDDLAKHHLRGNPSLKDSAVDRLTSAGSLPQDDDLSRINCSIGKPLATIGSEFNDPL
jgi:hypothetical protein